MGTPAGDQLLYGGRVKGWHLDQHPQYRLADARAGPPERLGDHD
jgi:hypothetical protein